MDDRYVLSGADPAAGPVTDQERSDGVEVRPALPGPRPRPHRWQSRVQRVPGRAPSVSAAGISGCECVCYGSGRFVIVAQRAESAAGACDLLGRRC